MSPTKKQKRFTPAAVRLVDDAAAIKALADPLRLRVIQLLMTDADQTWTVKEVATRLEQPVTKLYHHVKQLEAADLVKDVESRIVSGIVEHRYQSAQRSLTFDDALFGTPATRDASIAHVANLVDEGRDDLLRYLEHPGSDPARATLSIAKGRLTDDEVATIQAGIEAMVARFTDARSESRQRRSLPQTAMIIALHPVVED
jgi:DNA-binding transcriptional ArsR family regulator